MPEAQRRSHEDLGASALGGMELLHRHGGSPCLRWTPRVPSEAQVGGTEAGASHGSHDGLLIDELKHKLCDLGDLARRSAGPALTVEAFGAFESYFLFPRS